MDVKRYEANYIPYEGLDLSGACAEMHGRFFVHMEDFDRVTAERDALQLRLNAVEEENDRLRADAERYRWMKANVRNGSFGTDTGWIDDDTENWDCDIDIKRGVLELEWDMEKRP